MNPGSVQHPMSGTANPYQHAMYSQRKVTMNYYLASAALKAVSMSSLTRWAYRALARRKASPKAINKQIGEWLLSRIPPGSVTVLEIGTGWVSAYSVLVALLRPECRIHCFDVRDIRYSLAEFKRTVELTMEAYLPYRSALHFDEAKLKRVLSANSIDEAYDALGLKYQVRASGLPEYPNESFDCIFSIDVLEHVYGPCFVATAQHWANLLKSGGIFMAQVGLIDHTSYWCHRKDDKRYIEHSEFTWKHLLENRVQYINRLTASEIVGKLEGAGFTTLEEERLSISAPIRVHSDYAQQSLEDARCLRLHYRGSKLV
jgi:SAM-dependent methyltransferase